MRFSREMKAYFRYSIGYTTEPERAATYLYNLFVEEAYRGGSADWSCLFNSKAYKDLREAFLWADGRWGGNAQVKLGIHLKELIE